MVLEAILTGKQPHEKLQRLYVSGNLMSNIFRKTAVLPKKTGIVTQASQQSFVLANSGGRSGKKVLYTNLQNILKRGFSAVNFVNKILLSVTLVNNSLKKKKPAV